MTRRANRRYFLAGAAALLIAVVSTLVHEHTGSSLAHQMVGPSAFAAVILILVFGVAPWIGSLGLKYPIQNTRGFRPDLGPEPEKESGRIGSQGWRRRQERYRLQRTLAFGLYIEPDQKG